MLLALAFAALSARAATLGAWAAARAGVGNDLSTLAAATAGLWAGSHDRTWMAGQAVGLGLGVRAAETHRAVVGEVRWSSEFLGGATRLGLVAGPDRTDAGDTGWLLLGGAGLRWLALGDHLGPVVRIEAGGRRDPDGWRPAGSVQVGLEATAVLRRPAAQRR